MATMSLMMCSHHGLVEGEVHQLIPTSTFLDKQVVMAFPQASPSQFPERVKKADRFLLRRPISWS